jgi:hypothetical protein
MLINAPQIAKLFLKPRLWANRRLWAGHYGPVSNYGGRACWVPIEAVETFHGRQFTAAQLLAAGVNVEAAETETEREEIAA